MTFHPGLALKAAKIGRNAGSMGWYYKPEREQNFFYSLPFAVTDGSFCHSRDLPFTWRTLDDLAGCKIGATIGYTYTPEFQEYARSGRLDVEFTPSDATNIAKLMRGRLDLCLIDTPVSKYLLATKYPQEASKFVFNPKPLTVQPLHIVFSRIHPEGEPMLKLFNQGLEKLKKSGRYQEIMDEFEARYGAQIRLR